MAQDINEYCVGHNLTSIDLLGHSMGGKTACFLQLNILIYKQIIADIGPKFYQHHQTILAD
jgi:triacylglycerol esterase/lipase EstA (alpha/beta hydrolase family)